MPEYKYQGRNHQGMSVSGTRQAVSSEVLAASLVQEGIIPIHINQKEANGKNWQIQLQNLLPSKVSLEELLLFSRQMYTLNKAGIPILNAVTRLAETTRNAAFAKILRDIINRISSGQELATAMQQYPKVFSNLYVNVVRVGENTGRLDEAFQQLSQYLELEQTTKQRLKTAVRYPMFVLIAIVVAMLVINAFVIPAFSKLFANYKEQLPWATKVIIGSSNFLVSYWPWLLLATILIAIAIGMYVRSVSGRLAWDRYKLKIPAIGSIFQRILLSRFCRTFSLLLRSGIPVSESIKLVAKAMDNYYMEQNLDIMYQGIARGEGITAAARNSGLFSPLVLQMMAVGEETGQVDQMLVEVAEYYEREVDYDLNRINDAIEPILLIAIGAMVLILALGVFLPMWNMARVIKGG